MEAPQEEICKQHDGGSKGVSEKMEQVVGYV